MSGEVVTKGIIGETVDDVNVSVTANTNISGFTFTTTLENGWIVIEVTPTSAAIFSVMRTVGTTTVKQKMNSGIALEAGGSYIWTISSKRGETYNFQYSENDTLLNLYIREVA